MCICLISVIHANSACFTLKYVQNGVINADLFDNTDTNMI